MSVIAQEKQVVKVLTQDQLDKRQESRDKWRRDNPEYMVVYRRNNKDSISKSNKSYYETHKKAILAHYATTLECECGSVVRRNNMNRHKRCAKHQKFITNNNS